MSAYHIMAAHFPVAIWMTVFLFIVLRCFTPIAKQKLENAISILLLVGLLAGVVTYTLGWTVWSMDALLHSPLVRNHILMATWTLAYWSVLWLLFWRLGDIMWQGMQRWSVLLLSGLGAGLLAITGTLGGSLTGKPSSLPEMLATLGWDTNSTFYLSTGMLLIIFIISGLILLVAWYGRKKLCCDVECN